MTALLRRGRSAHPDLWIEDAAFAAHVARCVARVPAPTAGLPDLFAEDLYLACACMARVEGAAEAFRRRYEQTIRAALATLSVSSTFRDEVEQQLYEDLLLGRDDAPPRIGDYAGRGPLARWIAVVAQRAGLMMLRSESVRARARDAAARERVEASLHGETAFLKSEYRPAVDQMLVEVLGGLDRRDRVVLHLHLVGGAGVTKIGRMYGVNPSTVSRWLTQTRQQIVEQLHRGLRARLGLEAGEVESLMALVVSQLDISVSALLA